MDVQTPKSKTHATLAEVPKPARPSVPAIIVGAVIAVIASLSIWYLVRPVPLVVCTCPLSGVKRTWRLHCECLLLTQSGH